MQGMGGGAFTLSGLFMLYVNLSPLLIWVAIILVALGVVFLGYVWRKRRREAREAYGLLPIGQRIKT